MLVLCADCQRLIEFMVCFMEQMIKWITMKYPMSTMEKQVFSNHEEQKVSQELEGVWESLLLVAPG